MTLRIDLTTPAKMDAFEKSLIAAAQGGKLVNLETVAKEASEAQANVMQYVLMVQSSFGGVKRIHMEDISHSTQQEALDEACAHHREAVGVQPLAVLCVDTKTGQAEQIMDADQLEAFFEACDRDDMTDGEKAEQRQIDAYNFRHDTTI